VIMKEFQDGADCSRLGRGEARPGMRGIPLGVRWLPVAAGAKKKAAGEFQEWFRDWACRGPEKKLCHV